VADAHGWVSFYDNGYTSVAQTERRHGQLTTNSHVDRHAQHHRVLQRRRHLLGNSNSNPLSIP